MPYTSRTPGTNLRAFASFLCGTLAGVPRGVLVGGVMISTLVGCSGPVTVPTARPAQATSSAQGATDPAVPQNPTPAGRPNPTPTGPAEQEEDPNVPLKVAPAVPPAPKQQPHHLHKALTPDGQLILELSPQPAGDSPASGAAGMNRPVCLLVQAEVCLRRGPLEVFLCRNNTKEHESILRTNVDARLIHAGLVALGAKPGSPVQFVNPQTEQEDYRPAQGERIEVTVHYQQGGQPQSHPAQRWIRNQMTMQPMEHHWVFAGSQLLTNPDDPQAPPFYAANSGEVISVSNFIYAMLDIPTNITTDNAGLQFHAETETIPPVRTPVWVSLSRVAAPEKAGNPAPPERPVQK